MIIKLVDSSDYQVLLVDGKVYAEGHRIPDFVWLSLLMHVSSEVKVDRQSISDKDMEEGNY
jgi:hypothetical protein